MQKDYSPFRGQTNDNEIDRIEEFWSTIWDDKSLQPDFAEIEKTDEYTLLQPCLMELKKGSRIFDAGCGVGQWALLLKSRGFDLTGMDISKTTVERLSQKFPDVNFCTGDIRQTGIENNYFDLLISWGVFEHFENGPRECLEEAYRIMKPNAQIAITVPYQNLRHTLRQRGNLENLDKNFTPGKGYNYPQKFYQWRFTEMEIKREFEICGFQVEKVVPVSKCEGLTRCIEYSMLKRFVTRGSRLHFILTNYAGKLIPKRWISHMVMVIARKPC